MKLVESQFAFIFQLWGIQLLSGLWHLMLLTPYPESNKTVTFPDRGDVFSHPATSLCSLQAQRLAMPSCHLRLSFHKMGNTSVLILLIYFTFSFFFFFFCKGSIFRNYPRVKIQYRDLIWKVIPIKTKQEKKHKTYHWNKGCKHNAWPDSV